MIVIIRATHIKRNEEGTAYSWRQKEEVMRCKTSGEFYDYLDNRENDLSNIVAFDQSASNIVLANKIIADEIKKRKKQLI